MERLNAAPGDSANAKKQETASCPAADKIGHI
jgi:hypothetical protein